VLAVASLTIAERARAADLGPPLLFRPMLADPDEPVIQLRVQSLVRDERYGSDITDSTTTGGWIEDARGVGFDFGGGHLFRAPVWNRVLGRRPPWQRYQLGALVSARSGIDRIGAEYRLVADYRYGGVLEAQWSGRGDNERGVEGFRPAVLSSRTGLFHRSSHVGDELIGESRFGRNRSSPVPPFGAFAHPAIKRTVLSYESVQQLVALEWAPAGDVTLRALAGGEWKIGVAGPRPRRMRSTSGLFGLELRSQGDRADIEPGGLSRLVNRALGGERLSTSWFAAVEARVAKPFNFASCDNPDGDSEVWTPMLWTPCLHGREFRHYATTWYGRIGLLIHSPGGRNAARGGRRVGPEALLSLDWSHGYSDHGPFLDSRERSHPRWFIVPSFTTHF
jgi:hypothetical protein